MKHLKTFAALNESSNEERALAARYAYGHYNLSNANYSAEEIKKVLDEQFPHTPGQFRRVSCTANNHNFLEIMVWDTEDAIRVHGILTGAQIRACKTDEGDEEGKDDAATVSPYKFH